MTPPEPGDAPAADPSARTDADSSALPAQGAASAPATSEEADPVRQRVAAWRRQAADLGGRNPLLWYRDLAHGSFDLTVAHPGGVAKLLAGAHTLLSELVREQVAFGQARQKARAIRAKGHEIAAGHGLATSFIAVGMATWSIPRAPVPPRAPVLLRGCTITPTDAGHTDFTITADSEVVFNPVLAHYLTGEMGLDLDVASLVELSARPGGFDPRPVYQALERACADLDGFGIGPQMVVSTFPWAKLPFVAALADQEQLMAQRWVRTIARSPLTPPAFESSVHPVAAGSTALPTDISQRRVVAAARQGSSFVVQAPVGTGRTQCAATLAADVLERGGSVLVVAEPAQALLDLRRRLARIGLADRVLRLRETQPGLRGMAAELCRSLDQVQEPAQDAVEEPVVSAEALAAAGADHSAALEVWHAHQTQLHEPREPWGVSLAQVQEHLTVLAGRTRPPVSHVRLDGDILAGLSLERVAQVGSDLTEAARLGAWQRGRGDDPWYNARLLDDDEADRAGALVAELISGALEQARSAAVRVCAAAGLPAPASLEQWERYLDLLGRAHATLDIFRPEIFEAPLQDMVAALSKETTPRPSAVARARARRQARALLRPGTPPADLAARVEQARDQWLEWEQLAGRAARPAAVHGWQEAAEEFEPVYRGLTWLQQVLADTPFGPDLLTTHLDTVMERLVRLDARTDRLALAARSYGLLQPLREVGLAAVVDDLATRGIAEDAVQDEVDFVFWASLLDEMKVQHDGAAIRSALAGLEDAEEVLASGAAARAASRARQRAQAASEQYPDQARTLRSMRVGGRVPAGAVPLSEEDAQEQDWQSGNRSVVAGVTSSRAEPSLAPVAELAQALRPVWLAPPVVVPGVAPDHITFDLVIIDEAARTPIAHVLPLLSATGQIVALGSELDPPARSFRVTVDERAEEATGEVESSLQALAAVLPTLTLDIDHQSIDSRVRAAAALPDPVPESRGPADSDDVADGNAATPVEASTITPVDPAATAPAAVVPVGHSFPGVLRSPRVTATWSGPTDLAERVADMVLDHAKAAAWQSLAVLAPDRRSLAWIEQHLRERIAADGWGRAFRDDAAEALLLGTVDSAVLAPRDRVILALPHGSVVAPSHARTALLHARRSVSVVLAGDEQEWPETAGSVLLQRAVALSADDDQGDQGDGDDDVAEGRRPALIADLARRLRAEGLQVSGPLGSAPHVIDLAVNDPDDPGRPLVAVLTDAEPWTGDPDLLPRQLRRLGWTPEPIWCTDLFRDPAREVARISQSVRQASAGRRHR